MPKFSVKKPFTVFVAVVLILVMGIVSYTRMTPDLLPSINLPYVVVVTTYPGATPEKVETSVTKPLEQNLATLDDIKSVQSVSNSNFSLVILEFENSVNMDTISSDILQKVNLVEGYWDDMVGTPTIMKLNPNMLPVSVVAVDYEGKDRAELSAFVTDTLTMELEGTNGVASISNAGILEEKINVVINQDKLDKINNRVLASVDSQLADAQVQIEEQIDQVEKGQAELAEQKTALEAGMDELAVQKEELDDAEDAVEQQKSIVTTLKNALIAAKEQLAKGEEVLGEEAYAVVLAEVESLEKQITDAEAQLTEAEKQLTDGAAVIRTTERQLNDGRNQMIDAEKQLTDASGQLQSAKAQIDSQADQVREEADLGDKLTIEMISGILQAQNFAMPAGYIEEDGKNFLVSVGDVISTEKQANNLFLFDTGVDGVGKIYLKDVADVFVSDNAEEIFAKINGNDGVILTFNKQSNYATAEVCESLQEKFAELSEEYEGLEFSILMDQGDYIEVVIDSIISSLMWGAIFSVIILMIFLRDIRPTIITICSIPISLLFAIMLMYFSGISINMISMSGLAVSVGMLVDNSVVVIENTVRLRRLGIPAPKAAVAGAKQVASAITASTVTTVCVFAPIVFTEGLTRELFTDMALTVGYTLVASLIIALTLVPAMSARMLKNTKETESPFFNRMMEKYKSSLRMVLKHKVPVLILALVLLIGSVTAGVAKGFIFFPDMTSPQLQATMEMPKGSTLDETTEAADEAMAIMNKIEGIETVGATMGSGNLFGGSDTQMSVSFYIILDLEADKNSFEVAEEINKLCADLEKGEVKASGSAMGDMTAMMGGAGVSINVYNNDLDALQKAAKDLSDEMKKVEGIDTVESGIQDADKEYHFKVKKTAAMKKGLTVAQVYQAIAAAMSYESTATTMTWENDEYDVIVSSELKPALTTDDIKDLTLEVTGMDGSVQKVKLNDIATLEEKETLKAINRSDQKRYLTVTGVVEEGHNVTLVDSAVREALDKYELPEGTTIKYTGETETIMEALKDMLLMLALGVLFVYLVMVAQFQSLKSPFIIMFTIPLAFTGGLLALLLFNKEISIIAMIGMIMLVGIIVNNGIVLVDYINQLRAEGMEKKEAVVEAGTTRIRPILMTSLTTILGLVVMAFDTSAGTDMMQPLALVCIGGLLYATLLTLYIIPAVYDLMNKDEYKQITDEDLDISDIIT